MFHLNTVVVDSNSENKELEEQFLSNRSRTQILINSASIIDEADDQILPAIYLPLQQRLGFSLVQLGAITAVGSLLQSVSTPIWGWLSDTQSRKTILSLGCFLWGLFTFLLGTSDTYVNMLFFRAMTGIGLAVIIPTAQSLITDYFFEEERGIAFGWLGLTAVIGAIVGTLFATAIGSDIYFGIDGWRLVFFAISTFSIFIALINFKYGIDPVRGNAENELHNVINPRTEHFFSISKTDFIKILSNRTYILIVAQGIAGSLSFASLVFAITWFEWVGFPSIIAGIIFAVVAIGAALGNLFGGWIGDKASKWDYDKGRIIISQISVFSGIPLMITFFWILPHDNSILTISLFILVGSFTGFTISWSASATNYPIFSEIFEPEIRGSAYAIDNLLEGSIAASGTLIVSFLADNIFGYIPATGKSLIDLSKLSYTIRENNINALANALVISTVIPWLICLFIYFFVYSSYPRDRDKIKNIIKERSNLLKNGILH